MKTRILLAFILAFMQVSPAFALGWKQTPAPKNGPYLLTESDSRLPNATVLDIGDLLVAPISLTTEVTGILPVANGGTGDDNVAAHTVFGNNTGSAAAPAFVLLTSALAAAIPPSTDGNVLTSDGAGNWVSEAPAASGMTNPMTTAGDLITSSSGSTPDRVAAVAAGSLLRSAGTSTKPVWSTVTYADSGYSSGTFVWAGSGNGLVPSNYTMPGAITASTLLRATSTGALDSTTFTIPTTIASGTIFRASSANVLAATAYTMPSAAGTSGFLLGSDGTNFVSAALTAAQMATAVTPGTSGNVLTSNGTTWTSAAAAAGGGGLSPTNTVNRALRQLLIDSTAATTYSAHGISGTITQSGTPVNNAIATGLAIRHDSAASTNSDAGYDVAPGVFWTVVGPRIYFNVKPYLSIANCRIMIGITSAVATTIGNADGAASHAVFRYDTVADGTAFWRCLTNDGSGGGGATTTTQSIAAFTPYTLCIDSSDPASIKFYINGALVATRTTQLPSNSTDMGIICKIRTLENVAKSLYCGPLMIENP